MWEGPAPPPPGYEADIAPEDEALRIEPNAQRFWSKVFIGVVVS